MNVLCADHSLNTTILECLSERLESLSPMCYTELNCTISVSSSSSPLADARKEEHALRAAVHEVERSSMADPILKSHEIAGELHAGPVQDILDPASSVARGHTIFS